MPSHYLSTITLFYLRTHRYRPLTLFKCGQTFSDFADDKHQRWHWPNYVKVNINLFSLFCSVARCHFTSRLFFTVLFQYWYTRFFFTCAVFWGVSSLNYYFCCSCCLEMPYRAGLADSIRMYRTKSHCFFLRVFLVWRPFFYLVRAKGARCGTAAPTCAWGWGKTFTRASTCSSTIATGSPSFPSPRPKSSSLGTRTVTTNKAFPCRRFSTPIRFGFLLFRDEYVRRKSNDT